MKASELEIIKDHTEEIAKKINEQFELEKESIKEQLLDEIKGYITPVPSHYEWTRGDCPYDDSGELYVDGLVSLDQTIAEFLENEYTGEKEATYESHRGFYYECYGDKLCYVTQDIEGEILRKVTRKYLEELFGKSLQKKSLTMLWTNIMTSFTMVALHTNFSGMRQESSLPALQT